MIGMEVNLKMKVRMQDIIDRDEQIIIPLYFCGDETEEFVELDVESIQDSLDNVLREMEVQDEDN